jgi:hypothetical protein
MPKVFVMLTALYLDKVAVDDVNEMLPVIALGNERLADQLAKLLISVGVLQTRSQAKLIDVVQAKDGTVIIGFRIRTTSIQLNDTYLWVDCDAVKLDPEDRHLLSLALDTERP